MLQDVIDVRQEEGSVDTASAVPKTPNGDEYVRLGRQDRGLDERSRPRSGYHRGHTGHGHVAGKPRRFQGMLSKSSIAVRPGESRSLRKQEVATDFRSSLTGTCHLSIFITRCLIHGCKSSYYGSYSTTLLLVSGQKLAGKPGSPVDNDRIVDKVHDILQAIIDSCQETPRVRSGRIGENGFLLTSRTFSTIMRKMPSCSKRSISPSTLIHNLLWFPTRPFFWADSFSPRRLTSDTSVWTPWPISRPVQVRSHR